MIWIYGLSPPIFGTNNWSVFVISALESIYVLTAFLGLCILNHSSSSWGEATSWITVYDLSNVLLNLSISSLNHWVWINANRWDDSIQVIFASHPPSLLQGYQANTRLLRAHTQNCCSLWGTAECGSTIYVIKSPLFSEKALKTRAVAARAVPLSGGGRSGWSAGADTTGSGSTFGEDCCSLLSSLGLPLPPFLPPPLLFLHPRSWLWCFVRSSSPEPSLT